MRGAFRGESRMTSASVLDRPVEEILQARFGVDRAGIVALCQQFRIVELGVFGSAVRDDFRDGGDDVDLLVVFEVGYERSYQAYLDLETAVEQLFGRKVDICQKQLLKNPYSRADILRTNRVIYAS
jgi:uncharacterized protein